MRMRKGKSPLFLHWLTVTLRQLFRVGQKGYNSEHAKQSLLLYYHVLTIILFSIKW